MTTFLNDLESKARAATKGEWQATEGARGSGPWDRLAVETEQFTIISQPPRNTERKFWDQDKANHAFIVAVQPSVTLKLIEALRIATDALTTLAGSEISADDAHACNHPMDAADALAKINDLLK